MDNIIISPYLDIGKNSNVIPIVTRTTTATTTITAIITTIMTVEARQQCYRVSGKVTENESQPKFLNSLTVGRAILQSVHF